MVQDFSITDKPKVEPASTAPSASARLFWIVVGIPIALLLLAFPVINSSLFKIYGDPLSVSLQRGLFESSNRPCDILIYGDSTAEAGLDPVLISEETHLVTCNIATGGPTITVMGMDPFNRYLTRNPKPRYLAFQFASSYLHEPHPGVADLDHFDGVIQSIRYYGWLKTLPVILHSPDYIIGLLNYTYKSGAAEIFSELTHQRPHGDLEPHDSYLVMPRPPLQSCPLYNGSMDLPDPQWIGYLHQHYSASAEHVIVDVSPTSPCNTLYAAWKKAIADSTDNELEIYPNNLFVDGTYHTSREGAIRRSHEFAQQILSLEAKSTASPVYNSSSGNNAPSESSHAK